MNFQKFAENSKINFSIWKFGSGSFWISSFHLDWFRSNRSWIVEKVPLFNIVSLNLCVILSMKIRLLLSIDLQRMRGGRVYQRNPFWGCRKPIRLFLAMSNIYLCIFLFSKTEIIYSAWNQNRSNVVNGLSLVAGLGMHMSGNDLGSSVMPKLRRGGAERSKTQKSFPFWGNYYGIQSYITYPKFNLLGQLGGVIWGFEFEKEMFLPYFHTQLT